MLLTLAQIILPALVVFTTLFGLLARGDPKPGGVALFLRVGLVGLAMAAALFYVVTKTAAFSPGAAGVAANVYRGLAIGGALLVLMAAFGVMLKRKQ